MSLREYSTKVFDGVTGVMTVEQNDITLHISSPELAIMECLHLAPTTYNFMDVFYLMKSLTTLQASLVTQLLDQCSSVKVKRLFLYMTTKANHAWFKRLDIDNVVLGSGTRNFTKGGVRNRKYNIVIPR